MIGRAPRTPSRIACRCGWRATAWPMACARCRNEPGGGGAAWTGPEVGTALGSEPLRAVGWGVATHLVLDLVPDFAAGFFFQFRHWLLWPLFGWGFPPAYGGRLVHGIDREFATYIAGDVLGAALLVWQYV